MVYWITNNDDISEADNKDKKLSPEEKLKQFASPELWQLTKKETFI